MRKLIVGGFVSLDGVVENPWEWIGSYFNEGLQNDSLAKLQNVDTFFLGRKTYERFYTHWPNVKGNL